MEILAQNPKENKRIAKIVLQKLKEKNINLLLLQGSLGAGKTTFTRDIAKMLNCKNQVQSPTFVIQRIYDCLKNEYNFKKIYHIDLYRLTTEQEVNDIGLFEDLKNKQNLFIIEWPDIIEKSLKGKEYLKVQIIPKEDKRVFKLQDI